MTRTSRPIDPSSDVPRILAISAARGNCNQHVIDLPYRLASWALDYPHNTRLWTGADGSPAAWAILQTPFWTFDYAIHPALEGGPLHGEVLAWMVDTARAYASSPAGHPCWFADVCDALQPERARALREAGFVDISNAAEDPWSKVQMMAAPEDDFPAPPVPHGFTIRPLAGADEVASYVDLHQTVFGTKNMTVDWRARTLGMAHYRPDLDLVAVAPDGQLAAFCIGWLAGDAGDGLPAVQVEPLGVHPDFQGRGLGRAILGEQVRRMRQAGAQKMLVETDNARGPALATYQSAGFRVIRAIAVYRLDIYAA